MKCNSKGRKFDGLVFKLSASINMGGAPKLQEWLKDILGNKQSQFEDKGKSLNCLLPFAGLILFLKSVWLKFVCL